MSTPTLNALPDDVVAALADAARSFRDSVVGSASDLNAEINDRCRDLGINPLNPSVNLAFGTVGMVTGMAMSTLRMSADDLRVILRRAWASKDWDEDWASFIGRTLSAEDQSTLETMLRIVEPCFLTLFERVSPGKDAHAAVAGYIELFYLALSAFQTVPEPNPGEAS